MAMKGVGITATVKLALRATKDIVKDVSNAVLAGQIEFAQEVVAYAARHHPYKDQTGTNSRSIGWAAHGVGKDWGPIRGRQSAGGKKQPSLASLKKQGWEVNIADKDNNSSQGAPAPSYEAEVIVATTSGYGGYLETGTVMMNPFPYIIPALNTKRDVLRQKLTRIL